MTSFDDILAAYAKTVQLPWAADTPPVGRVWIVWYDKSLQRRFTGRLGDFETATLKAGRGWRQVDLSLKFGRWIAQHELFDALLRQPKEIRGLLPDFETALVADVKEALGNCDPNGVLAINGCGALFGVASVSTLIARVSDFIPGRLLIGFPGKHAGGVYRLLDARDGWNYHAIPIPPNDAF